MNTLRKNLLRLIKGLVIGVAIILPGVSGSTLAVILGIYDDIIDAMANFHKDFRKAFRTVWPLAVGAGIGFLGLWYPLIWIIKIAPLPSIAIFAGFILSGFPEFFSKVRGNANGKRIFTLLISLIIAAAIGVCSVLFSVDTGGLFARTTWWAYLVIFTVGAFIAAAIFIPGVSGTMLLIAIGFWTPLSDAFTSLLHLTDIWHNIFIMGFFGVGMVVGLLVFSRFMKMALEKHTITANFAIIGFVVGSIIAGFYNYDIVVDYQAYALAGPLDYILAAVMLIVGFALGIYLLSFGKKKDKKEIA